MAAEVAAVVMVESNTSTSEKKTWLKNSTMGTDNRSNVSTSVTGSSQGFIDSRCIVP